MPLKPGNYNYMQNYANELHSHSFHNDPCIEFNFITILMHSISIPIFNMHHCITFLGVQLSPESMHVQNGKFQLPLYNLLLPTYHISYSYLCNSKPKMVNPQLV